MDLSNTTNSYQKSLLEFDFIFSLFFNTRYIFPVCVNNDNKNNKKKKAHIKII